MNLGEGVGVDCLPGSCFCLFHCGGHANFFGEWCTAPSSVQFVVFD